jgi:hypothetical protein
MSSASRQTETQEKQEEPDHDAEGYEYGSWNSYVRGSPGEQLFLRASSRNACGRAAACCSFQTRNWPLSAVSTARAEAEGEEAGWSVHPASVFHNLGAGKIWVASPWDIPCQADTQP